ncbi:MAG: M28 family peptidase [Acidobacteria bacterium]|nr:M28 family peptidase [Acidobacteriota bacterium]
MKRMQPAVLSLLAMLAAGLWTGMDGQKPQPSWDKVWNRTVDARIRSVLRVVDSERMSRNLFALAKAPLPYRKLNLTLPGHEKNTLYEADDYIAARLESAGYHVEREGVRVQAFRRDSSKPKHAQYSRPMPEDPWYTAYNLYASRTGASYPGDIILVLAHKDSQSWIDSPGANDNAIGTVGVLEMATVLSKYRSRRTIRFLFCNEEHTPWTSVTAAQTAKARGDRIIAAFNIDGIGVKTAQDAAAAKKTNITAYTLPEGERLAELMSAVNIRYAIGLDQRTVKRTKPGDDDGSFIKAGYANTIVNIGSWPYGDPNYHTEGDIPELCDVKNAAMTVQATLAAILTLDQERQAPDLR